MLIDLTTEEINLICSLFKQSNLTMNRDSMIAFVNMTETINNKFLEAAKETPVVETPKEGE